MTNKEQQDVINDLVKAAEHILHACKDVPDVFDTFPIEDDLGRLIGIKKVAKQMIKYVKAK